MRRNRCPRCTAAFGAVSKGKLTLSGPIGMEETWSMNLQMRSLQEAGRGQLDLTRSVPLCQAGLEWFSSPCKELFVVSWNSSWLPGSLPQFQDPGAGAQVWCMQSRQVRRSGLSHIASGPVHNRPHSSVLSAVAEVIPSPLVADFPFTSHARRWCRNYSGISRYNLNFKFSKSSI